MLYLYLVSTVSANRPCPEGFVLGKLEPQHLDYVASQWYRKMREKSKHHLSYFDHMIRHCVNAAIFRADDPTKPVSFAMQYPYGQLGPAFTHEEYQKKGLMNLLARKIIKQTIADGDLPEASVVDGYYSHKIVKKVGYLATYKTMWLVGSENKEILAFDLLIFHLPY